MASFIFATQPRGAGTVVPISQWRALRHRELRARTKSRHSQVAEPGWGPAIRLESLLSPCCSPTQDPPCPGVIRTPKPGPSWTQPKVKVSLLELGCFSFRRGRDGRKRPQGGEVHGWWVGNQLVYPSSPRAPCQPRALGHGSVHWCFPGLLVQR